MEKTSGWPEPQAQTTQLQWSVCLLIRHHFPPLTCRWTFPSGWQDGANSTKLICSLVEKEKSLLSSGSTKSQIGSFRSLLGDILTCLSKLWDLMRPLASWLHAYLDPEVELAPQNSGIGWWGGCASPSHFWRNVSVCWAHCRRKMRWSWKRSWEGAWHGSSLKMGK